MKPSRYDVARTEVRDFFRAFLDAAACEDPAKTRALSDYLSVRISRHDNKMFALRQRSGEAHYAIAAVCALYDNGRSFPFEMREHRALPTVERAERAALALVDMAEALGLVFERAAGDLE